ncbi:DUF6779 domain-containing protein [Geodermatophilus maliterrae]|uniref:DUF6779 domain-containing protein n=1 Tax=Geodermatophilus maliterrae TaxID=3162531 RepID=A0ABV3XK99_9ACTN
MRGADDTAAGRAQGTAGSPRLRAAGLAVGGLLALAATAAVFLTDDPQLLRIAVVAVAWACLAAAVAAGRRPGDTPEDTPQADTAAVEAELRRAYDRELEREVAARQQYELELENQVRREAEEAMRGELEALRSELAGLREGVSGLTALREELAAVGALRGELAELAGLRADVGRLRAELTEQRSGEMHVERLVMRTQSVRTTPGREPLEPATAAWHADVARDLGAGWPVLSLDDRRAEESRETAARPEVVAAPPSPPVLRPEASSTGTVVETVAAPAVVREPEPAPRPLPPVPADDGPALRRRRTDPVSAPVPAPVPAEQLTIERPAVHTAAAGHAAGSRPVPSSAPVPPVVPEPDDAGATRLAKILAESGVTPGGRRHRYRDEGDGDDVLARVLGR